MNIRNPIQTALAAISLLLLATAAQAAVQGKEVTYSDGETTLKGYLAYNDSTQAKRPGVLVVHEWWGQNEYARKRARMLAHMGYLAIAVDMYGNGKTTEDPKEAGQLSGAIASNPKQAKARFEAAMKVLQDNPLYAPGQVAALGYCFGGGQVLSMARQGVPLKGVVSYHGVLSTATPAEPGKVKAQIAVFTGGADPMVPTAQVDAFKQEMDKAGAKYSVVTYPGLLHAFTNPDADDYAKRFNLPVGYDGMADLDSWTQTGQFLKGLFKP